MPACNKLGNDDYAIAPHIETVQPNERTRQADGDTLHYYPLTYQLLESSTPIFLTVDHQTRNVNHNLAVSLFKIKHTHNTHRRRLDLFLLLFRLKRWSSFRYCCRAAGLSARGAGRGRSHNTYGKNGLFLPTFANFVFSSKLLRLSCATKPHNHRFKHLPTCNEQYL
jgi:hypothetical protein